VSPGEGVTGLKPIRRFVDREDVPIVGILLCLLGLRILGIARRRGGLPELGLALWFLGCGVGMPIVQHFGVPGIVAPERAQPWLAFGQVWVSVGFAGLYVFAWRTFGADVEWRRRLACAGIAASALSYVGLGVLDGFGQAGGVGTLVAIVVRLVAIAWAFLETRHYAAQMARRVRLGLADPVVANRFFLWALWTGTILAVVVIGVGVRVLQLRLAAGSLEIDVDPIVSLLLAAVRLGGCVAAGCIWLSFFPPERYKHWLRTRGAAIA
jgi:hypothetical protein